MFTTNKWVNDFSTVGRYKINVEKSNVFQYTYNKQSENEIKETAFTIKSKWVAYL